MTFILEKFFLLLFGCNGRKHCFVYFEDELITPFLCWREKFFMKWNNVDTVVEILDYNRDFIWFVITGYNIGFGFYNG